MFVDKSLVAAAARRLDFDPEKLDAKLGDGPLELTPAEKSRSFRRQLVEAGGSAEAARGALERIISGNDLVSINYLAKGVAAARPVCRVQLRNAQGELEGFGTGFLIGPGVLMTNHHVFGSAAAARHAVADFDYELDIRGEERSAVQFRFAPERLFYANQALDFAIVGINSRSVKGNRAVGDWGWLKLDGTPGKSHLGEYLTIIQHPAGERKQVCVRENKLLKYDGDILWYKTDTLGGSSGSPVFNRYWQVVALHHSGVPKTDKKGNWLTVDGRVWDESMDESMVDWQANEGIRISSIVQHLGERMGSHPVVKALLTSEPPLLETAAAPMPMAGPGPAVWVEQSGDTASLVIPLRVPVELVRRQLEEPEDAVPDEGEADPPPAVEAVKIDQSTLDMRPGYQPDFLGTGALRVKLPQIPAALASQVAMLREEPSASELKYFNYSVVMNKQRRLAFFSAVNIDGKLRQDTGKRAGDTWLTDPRIEREYQIDNRFYGKQKSFEAARTENPFDRGHLVRRLDATWGATPEAAKQHGDDTFHFTNCAPQFYRFNQGAKLWLGLEEFVLGQLEETGQKACVFNGPVFDGPLTSEDGTLDPGGAAVPDPVFGGVAIPKYFWKLMVVETGGGLAAYAFLLSQQDQVLGLDRIHVPEARERLSAEEAKVYQVLVADLAKLTKLGFGKLVRAETKERADGRQGRRRIATWEDIRL